jgi:hypothetical protein
MYFVVLVSLSLFQHIFMKLISNVRHFSVKTASAFCLSLAKERVKKLFPISNVLRSGYGLSGPDAGLSCKSGSVGHLCKSQPDVSVLKTHCSFRGFCTDMSNNTLTVPTSICY